MYGDNIVTMNLHCLNVSVAKIGFRDSPCWNANLPPQQQYLLILLDAMLNTQT